MAHDLTESAQDSVALAPRRRPDPVASQSELYAALDLGTNSCRMLIATPEAGRFRVVDAFAKSVRLGSGLERTGHLSRGAIARTLAALEVCADKLARYRVANVRLVATEACRRAVNGRHFIERVRNETGIALEIISPQEEARLAVLGCHKLLEPGDGPAVIFDIGGGSTELVLVEPGDEGPQIRAWWSAPWGVVSLTESEGKAAIEGDDRVAAYERLRQRARDSFSRVARKVSACRTRDPAWRNSRCSSRRASGFSTTTSGVNWPLPRPVPTFSRPDPLSTYPRRSSSIR